MRSVTGRNRTPRPAHNRIAFTSGPPPFRDSGREDHVRRKGGLLLAPPGVELRIGVRARLRRVAPQQRYHAANRGRIPLDLDEVPDGGAVERHGGTSAAPLLPPLVVSEAGREAEAGQDRLGLDRVGNLDFPLFAHPDSRLEPDGPLVGQDGLSGRAAQAHGAPARGEPALRIVVENVGLVVLGCAKRRAGVRKLPAEGLEVRNGQLELDLLAPARASRVRHGRSRRAISWAFFPSTRPLWRAISSFMARPTSLLEERPFSSITAFNSDSTSASDRPLGR